MSGSATQQRAGSTMSTKQMARAAVEGRRVTATWYPHETSVSGYLVGMDDFHWFFAVPISDDIETVLVHKTGPDVVKIDREHSLANETSEVQALIREIGAPFVQYCERTHLGKQ